MSPVAAPLRSIIGAARTAVRRDALVATAVAVVAVIPAVLLVTWLLSLVTDITHRVPLMLDVFALVVATAIGVWAVRRWIDKVTDRAVAASAETQFGLSDGELQSVLEMSDRAPAGTSGALLRRAERNLADRLSLSAPAELAGSLARQGRKRRTRALSAASALFAAVLVVAFASPERSRASWTPLLSPVETIAASALPPISVRPGNVSVSRGADIDVAIEASQRDAVVLFWREAGDVLNETTVPMISANGQARIQDIDAPVKYWVRAPDGAVTDTFTITPIDPLLVSALTVDVLYPAYLRRASEHFEKDVPALEVPVGTELRINGRATRRLSNVTLAYEAETVELAVDGSTFRGSWRPRTTGTYTWHLIGDTQAEAAAAPAPLEIRVVGDMPPAVEVTYPGIDTLLAGDMKQLLVADASDDYAVVSASVISWRSSATGEREKPIAQPLDLEGDADRKLIRGVLDATPRRLLPGDTLSYYVRVTDNSPGGQSSVSRTFTLRVPGMEELRDRAQDQADDLVKDADALAKAMQQLQTRTRDLQRKSATSASQSAERGGGNNPGEQRQMSGEQAEQAKQVLERQEALTAEMQKLRDRIEALENASKQAGLQDPETQKRMNELKELYDQLLSPEMKKQMEDLRAALDKLDPAQVQKALEELAKRQDELSKKLDQSLDLMRRAAAEQEMTKLAQEAKELATQQDALAEQMKADDATSKDAAQKQKEIEKKTDALTEMLSKLQRKLSEQGENQAAGKTGEAEQQTKDAQTEMSQAAKEAGQDKSQQAGESAQDAADKLNEAAQTLDAARKEMSDNWKKDVQETVDNATQDAINLAQMQKELLDKMQANKKLGGSEQKPPQQGGQQQKPAPGMQQGAQEGKQQAGSKEQGQKEGGQAGQKGQGQKPGEQGTSGSSGQPGGSQNQMQQMRSDQAAVKQGLEQLGKNLQEAGQRSAMVNRDVSSALARANLSMDQTMKSLEQASQESMPQQSAEETLDALNRLALELMKNSQQIEQSESGTGLQEALKQLAELAKQQGSLNGKSNSLMPMNVGPKVMSQQLGMLGKEQRDIAQKLGGMNKGGARDDLLGRLDDLVKEADQIAKDLEGGRISPQTLQRQQELFHKLLDAGKTMERDEVSEERKAEAATPLPPAVLRALKPGLFENGDRYATPTAEQLRDMPPAYRRLILEYFQKLNAEKEAGAQK